MSLLVAIPMSMLRAARFARMVRTVTQQYMPGETAKSLQVEDLSDELITWLDDNDMQPVIVDDSLLKFKTAGEAMLFKMRWK